MQGIVLAGVLASFVTPLWLSRTNLDRAYYGTDTRAYQLLGGSLLALTPGILHRMHAKAAIRRFMPATALASLGGATIDNEWNYAQQKLMHAMRVVAVENQARI